MTVDELECHLLELKAKNLNIRGVLRKLLQLHCRFSNVDRAMEIHKRHEECRKCDEFTEIRFSQV